MTDKTKTRDTKTKEARPSRIPIGEARDVLSVQGKDSDRKYRWVNDEAGGERLAMFEGAGYRFETDKSNLTVGTRKVSDSSGEGSKISKYAGVDREGNKVFAYLMSISRDWYEEDQELKAQKIDELEEGMEVPDDVDYGKVKIGNIKRNITINK